MGSEQFNKFSDENNNNSKIAKGQFSDLSAIKYTTMKESTAPYLSFNLCMNMYQYGFRLEKALEVLENAEGLEMLHGAEDGSFHLLKAKRIKLP